MIHCTSIAGTIQREILKGTFTFRGVRIENYYPPAVTPEVWAQLQTRVRFPRKPGGATTKGKRIQSLFPAIVTCAHCGRTMHAQPYNGPDAPFSQRVYTCRSQEDGGAGENGHVCQGGQRIYIDAIERDFFAMVLSQNPVDFQAQKDDGRQAELDAALTELAEVSAKIRSIMKLADKYEDTEEADKELEPLYAKKRDLQTKIKTLEQKAARGIETAWLNVVKAFVGTLSLDQINDDQLRALLSAGESLHSQLWNQEVRFNLIGPLRTLVSRIEINASGQLYRIHFIGGTVGEWRDVSGGVDSIRKLHAQFNNTEEIKKLRSEGRKRWWAETGGHSAETKAKAKIKRAQTMASKSYAERQAIRDKQSAVHKARCAAMTPEQRLIIREKQVQAKLSRGPEQVREWAEKMNKKAAETRANRTPEQRAAISARMSASHRERYANMSPEEKAALSAKRKADYEAMQERMTPEQKAALKAKIRAGQQAFYDKLTPEERAAAYSKRCNAAREAYRAMTPEQRAVRKAQRRAAAATAYEQLSPEQKAAYHQKQTELNAAQAAAWANKTPEQKAAFLDQRSATRAASLAKMNNEERATAIANRKKGNAAAMAKIKAMSPEERAAHNAKVRAGVEAAFAKMTPEEKAAFHARRRAAQRAAFSALSPEVKAVHQAKRHAAQAAAYARMRAEKVAPGEKLEPAQAAA